MKIVVDAMGGDYAPKAVIAGVVEALKEFDVRITLTGRQEAIEAELKNHQYSKDRIEIVHTQEVVEMNDPAIIALRQKKDSSISVGVKLLKEPGYDAFISAGNTGAVVAAATIGLGMLNGVERPAIGLVIPTLKGIAFLMDVGATTDPKSEQLLQFAQMGSIYVQKVLGVTNPKIGLLNIGQEAGKGSGLEKETFKLMEDNVKNFIGNVEATEMFHGQADCIISDGYVGNVVIKVSEGLVESSMALIKREIKKSPLAILGALLMKGRLNHIKKLADYSEYGGAPLLGVNGLVMISHGRSSPKAIKNAIRATIREIEDNLLSIMTENVAKK